MELVDGQYEFLPRSKHNINFSEERLEIRPRYTIMLDILRDFVGGYERWAGDDYIVCEIR